MCYSTLKIVIKITLKCNKKLTISENVISDFGRVFIQLSISANKFVINHKIIVIGS